MTKLPFGLSPSKIKEHSNCVAKFFYNYYLKLIPFTETEATIKGKFMHKVCEDTAKGKLVLNSDWEKVENWEWLKEYIIPKFQKPQGRIEVELGVGINEFNGDVKTGIKMWDKNPDGSTYKWLGQVDFVKFLGDGKAIVIDWKSGKRFEHKLNDYTLPEEELYPLMAKNELLQLEFYALVLFLAYPSIDRVRGYFIFNKDKVTQDVVFYRKDLDKLIGFFNCKYDEIYKQYLQVKNNNDTVPVEFHNPTKLCDWCGYKDKCLYALKK